MVASPSTTRARRADARLLHHVLDAPTQFGAPPQKKIFAAGGLTPRPTQDRWHSFVGDLKPEQIQDRWENQIIGRIPDREVRGWQRVADAAADQRAGIAAAQAIDLATGERAEGPVIFWLPALARYLGGDLQTCRLGVTRWYSPGKWSCSARAHGH